MDPSLVELVVQGGPLGVMIVMLVLIIRGTFRLDREYIQMREDRNEMQEDRNKWRELALRTTRAAGEAVTLLRNGGVP